jgi:hypothetical protein
MSQVVKHLLASVRAWDQSLVQEGKKEKKEEEKRRRRRRRWHSKQIRNKVNTRNKRLNKELENLEVGCGSVIVCLACVRMWV